MMEILLLAFVSLGSSNKGYYRGPDKGSYFAHQNHAEHCVDYHLPDKKMKIEEVILPAEKKINGMWAAERDGIWLGGRTTRRGKREYFIEVVDQKENIEMFEAIRGHEAGHVALIEQGVWNHPQEYSHCFWNWIEPYLRLLRAEETEDDRVYEALVDEHGNRYYIELGE